MNDKETNKYDYLYSYYPPLGKYIEQITNDLSNLSIMKESTGIDIINEANIHSIFNEIVEFVRKGCTKITESIRDCSNKLLLFKFDYRYSQHYTEIYAAINAIEDDTFFEEIAITDEEFKLYEIFKLRTFCRSMGNIFNDVYCKLSEDLYLDSTHVWFKDIENRSEGKIADRNRKMEMDFEDAYNDTYHKYIEDLFSKYDFYPEIKGYISDRSVAFKDAIRDITPRMKGSQLNITAQNIKIINTSLVEFNQDYSKLHESFKYLRQSVDKFCEKACSDLRKVEEELVKLYKNPDNSKYGKTISTMTSAYHTIYSYHLQFMTDAISFIFNTYYNKVLEYRKIIKILTEIGGYIRAEKKQSRSKPTNESAGIFKHTIFM